MQILSFNITQQIVIALQQFFFLAFLILLTDYDNGAKMEHISTVQL